MTPSTYHGIVDTCRDFLYTCIHVYPGVIFMYAELQSITRVAYARENLGTEIVGYWYSNMVGAGRLYDFSYLFDW